MVISVLTKTAAGGGKSTTATSCTPPSPATRRRRPGKPGTPGAATGRRRPAAGRSRRQGLLAAVGQEHDPQQPLAVFLAEHVLQHRADGRLLARWTSRQGDAAIVDFHGMRLRVERIDLDLEIPAHVASAGTQSSNVARSESQRNLLFSRIADLHAPRLVDQQHQRSLFLMGSM